jgi:type VI protein secretion system component Hcp
VADLPDVYLRFEDIRGECLDEQHPGDFEKANTPTNQRSDLKEGWMGINRFSFGFGWGGSKDAAGAKDAAAGGKAKTGGAQSGKPAAATKGGGSAKGGTLAPKEFSFAKSPNVASIPLVLKCYNGETIPKVEVEVCRYGGTDRSAKIPFLRFVFEFVQLVDCKLDLAENALPSESLVFKFGKVTMETVWTDNETGDRVLSDPRRVSWDFDKHEGKTSWDSPQS